MASEPKEESISILPAIVFIGSIGVIVTVFALVFNYINITRNDRIVQEYTKETNVFIEQNRKGIEYIFTDLYPKAELCNELEWEKSKVCARKISDEIYKHVSTNLTDFSSTFFIKMSSKSNTSEKLKLDGTYEATDYFGNEDDQNNLQMLLHGEVDSIPWANYFYDLNSKQVIIPVYKNGEVIGAIVRGVIK